MARPDHAMPASGISRVFDSTTIASFAAVAFLAALLLWAITAIDQRLRPQQVSISNDSRGSANATLKPVHSTTRVIAWALHFVAMFKRVGGRVNARSGCLSNVSPIAGLRAAAPTRLAARIALTRADDRGAPRGRGQPRALKDTTTIRRFAA
jgi:hypothetical protein